MWWKVEISRNKLQRRGMEGWRDEMFQNEVIRDWWLRISGELRWRGKDDRTTDGVTARHKRMQMNG